MKRRKVGPVPTGHVGHEGMAGWGWPAGTGPTKCDWFVPLSSILLMEIEVRIRL